MDNNSLAHTRWNCKYHIVFAPKYRRKAIYGEYKKEIGKILRELCTWKGVEIIEAHACVDHIHMYVSIPPKISVSGFVGFLKGKSSLIIFERHTNLKYKYGQRHFLVSGILCRYRGTQCKSDSGIHTEPRERGYNNGSNKYQGVYRSV